MKIVTTQHNLNTVVGLDTKMTVQTQPLHHPTPPQKFNGSLQKPQINIDHPIYLVQTGFTKIEPVTCKILTFLPKNTGIKLKTMHARGIYEKVAQVT